MKTQNLWNRFLLTNYKEKKSCNLKLHFEKGIEPDLKALYIELGKWLRKTYCFPLVLNVYIINAETVRIGNGKMAYGSFKWFAKRPPRIKIPSAVEPSLKYEYSNAEIYEMIISSLIHEITHYYQWYEKTEQSNSVSERQANYFRYKILDEFYNTKE